MHSPITSVPILRFERQASPRETYEEAKDSLATEEPLEIRLEQVRVPEPLRKTISITMRTPGQDADLALGFLVTEGILKKISDVQEVAPCTNRAGFQNVIRVQLKPEVSLDLSRLERHFYTNSSCGVCGKTSIEALRAQSPYSLSSQEVISSETILTLPFRLKEAQKIFQSTGGLHASALFNLKGDLLLLREDVGRHNALDKLIGSAWREGRLPLERSILLLSGRVSFELVQKAAMAGIPIIAAIGAPSSLAVELAQDFQMTLMGFLRENRFNIYCGQHRVTS